MSECFKVFYVKLYVHSLVDKLKCYLYITETKFLLQTRVKNSCPPPSPGSHNRTATYPSSNHVIASTSSGCTQGTKYVLFGQPPYRSTYTTTRHSAGTQFKTINIYSTIFKSLIKYPNKPRPNDVHACLINVNKQSSITVWVLILVLQSKYVCLSVSPSNGARTDLDYKIRVQTHNAYHNKS